MNIAIITGVSQGLGLALAKRYLESGWLVLGIGRRSALMDDNYRFIECDLSEPNAVSKITFDLSFDQVLLINNAGILGDINRISDQEKQDAAEVFQINVIAPIELTHKVARICGKKTPLTVVNISSGAGRRPIASWANYGASKAALDQFSETFQLEEQEKGLPTRVFSVAPGVIDTDMQGKIRSVKSESFSARSHFISLKNEGQLSQPSVVAIKIEELVKNPANQDVICRI